MATTEAFVPPASVHDKAQMKSASYATLATLCLTIVAVFIHGFHPYAEDGGIYLPGVIKILHPDLYPTMAGFVTAQTKFSLFAPLTAAVVRITHLDVVTCIFCAYVASTWMMLYAAWRIVSRCYRQPEAIYAGVAIVALCLTMPIAGTSLLLMDPYVTARSISTPCTVLALASALDIIFEFRQRGSVRIGSIATCLLTLAAAALMHPLMGSYAAGCVLLLACASIRSGLLRTAAFIGVGLLCVAIASALYFFAPAMPSGYAEVAQSRNYWFLANWHWYELLGLIAPLVLLQLTTVRSLKFAEPVQSLARMAVAAGVIGLLISLAFAHESSRSYIIAMLQPLRIFLVVYGVLLLIGGAELGRRALRDVAWRWTALAAVLGGLMFFVQWQSFPHSAHLELPWARTHSDWEQGFRWIRENTAKSAVVAIDANYILSPGEDAQNFRAVAERSMLPDYAKDGGIAAIEPELTAAWLYGEQVQAGLAQESDATRVSKLAGAHVEWLILPSTALTAFRCPYKNRSMKVCNVPSEQAMLRADTSTVPTHTTVEDGPRDRAVHPASIRAQRATASFPDKTPGQE